MPSTRIAKRTLRIPVPRAGQLVNLELPLPNDMTSVTGIAVSGDRRDLIWQRGTIGVSLNGEDLIVEGEPASEYMFGSSHPSRTFAFGEIALANSDRTIRVRYTDTEAAGSAFSAYTVQLVLTYSMLTNK